MLKAGALDFEMFTPYVGDVSQLNTELIKINQFTPYVWDVSEVPVTEVSAKVFTPCVGDVSFEQYVVGDIVNLLPM